MLPFLDFIREFNLLSIAIRLGLALICGGIIGIEREAKRRPAGFRTHILICLGAAIATLTSQYLYLVLHLHTDVARIGAQVIAGIGFIGTGAIIITRGNKIKGLTTAAGLWTTAIIGLACGAGYVEGAVLATVLLLVAELFLIKLEYRFARKGKEFTLYIEYEKAACLESVYQILRAKNAEVLSAEVSKAESKLDQTLRFCAMLLVHMQDRDDASDIMEQVGSIEGIIHTEDL